MMDILNELQTIGLTALFNPTFLFLLILLFFLGKLVGWMTRNINIWKFLALAYFGIFLFRPLQDAGLIIGGVFILGVASMYMDLFRGIFGWAGGIGDVVSAFRFNGAYKDIQRLEREVEELKSQMRASQMAGATAGGTAQQSSWRAQSQARKSKAKPKASSGNSTGGRSDGRRGSRFSQGSKSRGQPSNSDGSQQRRSASASTTRNSKTRSSSGSRSSQQKSTSQSSNRAKPSAGPKARASASQSQKQSQSSSQSNQKTAGSQSQGRSQSQSGAASGGPTSTPPSTSLRDKYLTTLELTPGQTYTEKDLKAAWRKMAFKTHPDRGGSAATFAECMAAYRALI